MIRLSRLLALLVVTATGVSLGAEPGFTELFNGRDLSGWKYGKDALGGQSETSDGRFSVSGGVITMAAKDRNGRRDVRDLVSATQIDKDFVVRLEFKAAQESTAFVTVRQTAIPVADFVRRNDQRFKKFKNDDWNELEVTVKMVARADGRVASPTDHLELTFVNGRSVVKFNGRQVDPNPTTIALEAYARVNGEPLANYQGRNIASRGSIGLRTGSGKMEFRNIRYRELP